MHVRAVSNSAEARTFVMRRGSLFKGDRKSLSIDIMEIDRRVPHRPTMRRGTSTDTVGSSRAHPMIQSIPSSFNLYLWDRMSPHRPAMRRGRIQSYQILPNLDCIICPSSNPSQAILWWMLQGCFVTWKQHRQHNFNNDHLHHHHEAPSSPGASIACSRWSRKKKK